ncbi:MAG: TonB-dependent receptor [Balneolaceae bacterium]|nr:TonB-dependent receptor [Balneolaceae bacterium]
MKFSTSFLITIIFLLTGLNQLQAQNQPPSISGKVVDENSMAIPNASVALYDRAETEIISGTVTNPNGEFTLTANTGSYVLEISYVAFQDYQTDVSLSSSETVKLGTIELQEEENILDEVVVTGERSYMEMNFDSRTFNVGSDITSLGGSALDVLDNVPSITTDFEGNVSLRGNQGVQVLINGRPSNLVRNGTDALSSIPASMIQEIKIITNPSARYAADGTAGIIDIILVDDVRLGFNGSVQANTGMPQDHGIGANLNYHVNNINWFLNVDFEYENEPRSGSTFRSFSADTTFAFEETTDSRDRELEGSTYFGADIFLPGEQVLTASARINLENERENTDVFYRDYDPGSPGIYQSVFDSWDVVGQTQRENIEEGRENDYSLRLQYENQLGGRDHMLTADFDFEFGQENNDSNLNQIIDQGQGSPLNQRTFGDEVYREIRFDTDYERPLGDWAKFESGMRISMDWLDNDYRVEELQSGNWVLSGESVGISDNFTYYENVNALYAILNGNAGDFTFQLGVRGENTRIETELSQTGAGSSQNYLNLFPSAFLSYTLNEQNSVQINYSRRISRPWSRLLLPFTEISDTRSRRLGNPELRPEFGNSYEVGYMRSWETGSLLSSFYYRYRTDVIERVTTIDGQGFSTSRPINLATENAWGVEFTFDQRLFSEIDFTGSLNLFQAERDGTFEGTVYGSQSDSFTSRMRIRWRFLDTWNFQANAYYRGPQETTQGRRQSSMQFGSGISKRLFDGNATISLNVRDLFNTRFSDREIFNPNSYTSSQYRWSTRSLRLNFRYNFSSDGGPQQSGRGGNWRR